MKDAKRKILEMRYLRENAKFGMNSLLFRNTIDRFDDDVVKDVFLAMQYLNSVMETYISNAEINENDLSENNRTRYLVMKKGHVIGDVLLEQLSDDYLSNGSE